MSKLLPTKCPGSGCGFDVRRPKCAFELNPALCPRHPLKRALDEAERQTAVTKTVRCPHGSMVSLTRTKPQGEPFRFRSNRFGSSTPLDQGCLMNCHLTTQERYRALWRRPGQKET